MDHMTYYLNNRHYLSARMDKAQRVDDVCYFDYIPNEIFTTIIGFVEPSTATFCVCKKWERICSDFYAPTTEDFIWSCKYGQTKSVLKLLKYQSVDLFANDNEAIKAAWNMDDDIEVVKALLKDERIDPSANENHALEQACMGMSTEIVKLLLEDKRVNPNDSLAFKIACAYGCLEIVKLLLSDIRVDPTKDGNIAFQTSFSSCRFGICSFLLKDRRIDPNALLDINLLRSMEHIVELDPLLEELQDDDRTNIFLADVIAKKKSEPITTLPRWKQFIYLLE
jgi:hypothetical protein